MRLSKLVKALGEGQILFDGEWEREIFSLFTDSRCEVENGLFFCLNGENADGHSYAAEGVKNGAVAIVTEKVLPVNVPQLVVFHYCHVRTNVLADFAA